MTLLLGEEEVKKILTFENTLETVEEGFRQWGKGLAGWNALKTGRYPPPRCEIRVEGKGLPHGSPKIKQVFQSMAYLEEADMAFLRWSFNLGEKSGNASYLFDTKSGEILAIIRAPAIESYMRTGADGAIGAKFLSRKDCRVAGVLGTGRQGRAQLQFLSKVRDIEKVYSYSGRRKDEVYAREMGSELGIDVIACDGVREVVRNADVLMTATRSQVPLVKGEWINEGLHISSIGADCPLKAELDLQTFKKADKIYVDDWEVCLDTKDLKAAIDEGILSKDDIDGNIGEVVAGVKPGRESPSEVTIYRGIGSTVPYVTLNAMVYEKAVEMGLGRRVDDACMNLIYSVERARG